MANRYCPRCGSTKIVKYEDSYECLDCYSKFILDDESKIEDKDKLTIQEMTGILNELGLDVDKTKTKRLKEILDSEEE